MQVSIAQPLLGALWLPPVLRTSLHRRIQWTVYPDARLPHDMRVDLRCLYALVAKQLLDGPDVSSAFQQVGGEGMPQHVRRHPLVDLGPSCRALDRILKRRIG